MESIENTATTITSVIKLEWEFILYTVDDHHISTCIFELAETQSKDNLMDVIFYFDKDNPKNSNSNDKKNIELKWENLSHVIIKYGGVVILSIKNVLPLDKEMDLLDDIPPSIITNDTKTIILHTNTLYSRVSISRYLPSEILNKAVFTANVTELSKVCIGSRLVK